MREAGSLTMSAKELENDDGLDHGGEELERRVAHETPLSGA